MVEREWVLLNPGPANTSLSVKQALVTPDLCHREPEFFEVMRECRERLVRVVGAADGVDFVAASANKCLQGIPGVSFVLGRRAALEALRGRAPRSVYLDLWNHYATQEQDNTPFTPAVQVLHAMRQALIELEQEGLAARIARYGESARVLREGMMALGFEILVPAGARSRLLTTFRLLPGLDYDGLHDAMKRRGYIIYAGQGDVRTYAFRVSNMGTLTPADMKGVADAFAASLEELGVMTGSTRSLHGP